MRMRAGFTAALFSVVTVAAGGWANAQPAPQPVRNIVLVHGAFADGSSWSKVIPILQSRGLNVVAVQNPLTSLKEDVDATRRTLALQDGPVILVGHSWGGAVITEVGDHPKVAGLVYVAAYVPDAGSSANDTSAPFGKTPGHSTIQVDSERFASMSEGGILHNFAEGLPLQERRVVFAVQGRTFGPMFDEKLTHAAWKSKPSWHVITTRDRTLMPAMQEAGAKKAAGKVLRVPSCHVVMLQEPQKVAELIVEAARDARSPVSASARAFAAPAGPSPAR